MAGPQTNRERVLAALACQNAPGDLPFLPWGLDALAAPPHPSYAPLFQILGEKAAIKRRWVGHHDFFLPAPPVVTDTQKHSRHDGTVVETVHLRGPGGELTCERRGIPGTTASEATSRYLKSEADVERYLEWPFVDQPADAEPYFGLDRDAGSRGVVTHRIPSALGVVGEAFEPEPFALCSVENNELVLTLIEVIAQRVTRYVRRLLEGGARPIFIIGGPEFATPPLLSPRRFDDYVVRFDQPLIGLIHSYGCRVLVHCHGRLNAVLERFVDMGVDGLHPIETLPMGDVTLTEVKRRVGDRLCLVGNVQIGDMMSAEPEDIRRQVRAIRAQVPVGMILTTSATPYESPMSQRLYDNYVAAIEAANEWR